MPASETGHVHPLPPAPEGRQPLPVSLAPPPEHLRRRIAAAHRATANAAVAAGIQPYASGPAGGPCGNPASPFAVPGAGAGTAGPGPAGTKSRLRVGSEAGASRWAGLMPYFMLRHTMPGRRGGGGGVASHHHLSGQDSNAGTPKSAKAAAASNPSGSLTMIESAWDLISRPLQPLLAGKRNTRLRQIVQVRP